MLWTKEGPKRLRFQAPDKAVTVKQVMAKVSFCRTLMFIKCFLPTFLPKYCAWNRVRLFNFGWIKSVCPRCKMSVNGWSDQIWTKYEPWEKCKHLFVIQLAFCHYVPCVPLSIKILMGIVTIINFVLCWLLVTQEWWNALINGSDYHFDIYFDMYDKNYENHYDEIERWENEAGREKVRTFSKAHFKAKPLWLKFKQI